MSKEILSATEDEKFEKFFAELKSNAELAKQFEEVTAGLNEEEAVAKIAETAKAKGYFSDEVAKPSAKQELDEKSMEGVTGGVAPVIAFLIKVYKIYQYVKLAKAVYDACKGDDKKDSGSSGGGRNIYTNNNQGGKQNNNQQGNENKNSSKGNSIAELNLI